MGETTETIRLRLQADQFAVEIQKQKDHIKDLNYSLKQTDLTLKQRKQIIIDKANAEKNLKSLQKQAKETEKALKKTGDTGKMSMINIYAGVQLAIGAYKTVTNALKKFISSSNEQEKQNIKVSSSFGDQAYKINEFSQSIQQATGVGNELIQEWSVAAKTLGAADENIEKIIKGAIGLKTTVGMEATVGIRALTLALEKGDYTMLNRYIPTLRTAKSETEKAAILNDVLTKSYAISEAVTKTAAGQMDLLSTNMGDLYEKIGDLIKVGLTPIIPLLNTLAMAAQNIITLALPDEFKNVSKNVKDAHDKLVELRTQLKGLTQDQLEKKLAEVQEELKKIEEAATGSNNVFNTFNKVQEETTKRISLTDDVLSKYNTDISSGVDLTEKATLETDKFSASNKLNERQMAATGVKTFELKKELEDLEQQLASLIVEQNINNEEKTSDIELSTRQIEAIKQTSGAIEEVVNQYIKLKTETPNLAVTFQEVWSSVFQGVGSIANFTMDEWSQTVGVVNQYVQNISTIFDNMYQSQINQANAAKDAKIEALEAEYASSNMSQEEYEKKKLKIEQESDKKLRELKKKQQNIDVLKTTASGISASIESFKNAGGWPWGIVPAAVMTGIWTSAVAQIKSQKLALGGVANGPSHAQGGINIGGNQEIEGGEGIINKRSMSNPYLYNAASRINQAGGGVAFPGTRKMANGGVTYAFTGSSTARIERLLESVNRNIAGLELSVAVNNSASGMSMDKIASEVTKIQNRFAEKGGNLAGV